jgi:D-aminoacyl-tRNA deacylase
MRVVLQRVSRAGVKVAGDTVGEIGAGLLLLCAFQGDDDEAVLRWMAGKCCELRVFRDQEGLMNRSVQDVGGAVLAVSQFTLYGDCRKGRRPGFSASAPADQARQLYERFLEILSEYEIPVASGEFQAMMEVELVNDGPVTLIIDRQGEGGS